LISRPTASKQQQTALPIVVAQVYRRLLNVVALPFSPLASDSLQKKQAALGSRDIAKKNE
jgi:hypothetical protein